MACATAEAPVTQGPARGVVDWKTDVSPYGFDLSLEILLFRAATSRDRELLRQHEVRGVGDVIRNPQVMQALPSEGLTVFGLLSDLVQVREFGMTCIGDLMSDSGIIESLTVYRSEVIDQVAILRREIDEQSQELWTQPEVKLEGYAKRSDYLSSMVGAWRSRILRRLHHAGITLVGDLEHESAAMIRLQDRPKLARVLRLARKLRALAAQNTRICAYHC